MGDRAVFAQQARNMRRVGLPVIRLPVKHVAHPGMAGDIRHAQAVSTVGADEQLVPLPDNAGEHGFDAEGAAALHEHRGIFRFGHMRQFQQACADALGDRLVVVVPGAVVEQHLPLDRIGRCQRSGREQLIIVVHIHSPLV